MKIARKSMTKRVLSACFAFVLTLSTVTASSSLLFTQKADALPLGETILRPTTALPGVIEQGETVCFSVKEVIGLGGDGWSDVNTSLFSATIKATTSAGGITSPASGIVTIPPVNKTVQGTFCYQGTVVGNHTITLTSSVRTLLFGTISDTLEVPVAVSAVPVPANLRLNGDKECGYATNVNNITANWDAVNGAVSYDYKVNLPDSTVFEENLVGTSKSGEFGGEGTSSFSVRAVNAFGYKSEWSAPCAVTYDVTDPTASISYSNNNGNALTNGNVTATLTANEAIKQPTGWDKVTDKVYTKSYANNGSFTVNFEDLAGNTATKSGQVKRIDRNAPTISGVVEGAVVKSPVILSIFDPKYEGYDGYSETNGLKVNGVTTPTVSSTGKTYLVTISKDGQYEVTATDKAGNPKTINFTIDTVPPVVTLQSIAPITVGETAKITGTVNDPTITEVDVTVGGKTVGTANAVDGVYTYDLKDLSVGYHTIAVKATDKAGNTGSSKDVNVVVNVPSVFVPNNANSGPMTLNRSMAVVTPVEVAENYQSNEKVDVLGESTQNNAAEAGKEEVLATTTDSEVKGDSTLAPFGIAWYWWILILAVIGALSWLFAAWRQNQNEEA